MAKFPTARSLKLLCSGLLATALAASDVVAQGSYANPRGGAAPSAPSVGRATPPSGGMPSGRGSTWPGPRNYSSPRSYGYRDGGSHRRTHPHRGGVLIYGNYGYYPSYGYRSCEAYHRRAINTGSRYWWRRYRECRGW